MKSPWNLRIGLLVTFATALVSADVRAHWGVPEPPRPARERMYNAAKHGGNYMHNFYFPPAPSSTPWAPCWSPDGKWIAFSQGGSIWRVDPETGIAEELTYNEKYHSEPDWSPDGKWIVYTADDGGQLIQLEILDVETGESWPLTNDEHIYVDPMFSPDGSRLAYVSTKPNGYFNVYVRSIRNGRFVGEELAVTTDNNFGRDRLYFGPWDMHITPEWTRDGRELLLVSNRNVALGSGDVWRVPLQAEALDEGRTVLSEQSLYRARPDVSIDGKRFVYSSTGGTADQYSNLYVLPVDGGQPYKLTFYEHDAFHPRWSPDGEWIVYVSNEGGLPGLELLETYGGKRKRLHITDRRFRRPTGILYARTVDAGLGTVTASRIHLAASDGKFYAPTDTYARITQGGLDRVFHTEGRFRVEVPVGTLRLQAVKGFEYWPHTEEVEIRPGEVTMVTLPLERMTDMAAKGWYSGSTHMHMNYGGNLHNTLENLMLMSAAEDQDVVNELVANKDNRVLDYQYFVPGGGPHPVSTPDRLVMVSQEYRPPFYGHVFLIGLRDHLISPWATGYEDTAIESLYPSNTDMLRKALDQEAITGYVHAFFGERDPIEQNLGQAKGFMVDAALGTTDGVEWSFSGHATFHPWYAVLNNGLRVTATGGEDSMSDLHISKMVGSSRTYVHTGERGLEAEAWRQGIREGRAFVSTGPLVEMTIDGHMPGETIDLPVGGGEVELSVWVRSITPLQTVTLISNGRVVEEIPLSGDRRSVDYRRKLRVDQSRWFHVRAEGTREESHPLDTGFAQGFTNPIWVTVAGRPVRDLASAQYSIRWIELLEELAGAHPGWRSEWEREHVLAQFREAKAIYAKFAEEARAVGVVSEAAEP
jgi:TolB protein